MSGAETTTTGFFGRLWKSVGNLLPNYRPSATNDESVQGMSNNQVETVTNESVSERITTSEIATELLNRKATTRAPQMSETRKRRKRKTVAKKKRDDDKAMESSSKSDSRKRPPPESETPLSSRPKKRNKRASTSKAKLTEKQRKRDEKRNQRWEEMFGRLQSYKQQHGVRMHVKLLAILVARRALLPTSSYSDLSTPFVS